MALLRRAGAALGARLAVSLTGARGIAALQPSQQLGLAQQQQQPTWAQQPWQQQRGFAAEPAAAAAPLPPPPDVYVRLPQPVSEPYAVPHKRVYAVVEVGGTQYKVAPNDLIVTEKLAGVDVNDRLQLRRVLLLGSAAETIIGRPYVPEAAVTAAVEVSTEGWGAAGAAERLACVCHSAPAPVDRHDAAPAVCRACSRGRRGLHGRSPVALPRPGLHQHVPAVSPFVCTLQEQFLDGKVLIFHKRRRKNSRRLRGHRQVGEAQQRAPVADVASFAVQCRRNGGWGDR